MHSKDRHLGGSRRSRPAAERSRAEQKPQQLQQNQCQSLSPGPGDQPHDSPGPWNSAYLPVLFPGVPFSPFIISSLRGLALFFLKFICFISFHEFSLFSFLPSSFLLSTFFFSSTPRQALQDVECAPFVRMCSCEMRIAGHRVSISINNSAWDCLVPLTSFAKARKLESAKCLPGYGDPGTPK